VDLRPLGLQAEVALPPRRAADAVHEPAVDRQLDDPVHGHDVVGVPLAAPEAAVLDRHAALAPRVVGDDLHAAHAEELAVDVGEGRYLAVARVELHPVELQHLDLDAVGQPVLSRPGAAPDEDAGVAPGLDVHPLDVEDEVLVLPLRAHHADRVPGADDLAVADRPRVGAGVDVHPAGQCLSVEEVDEALAGGARRGEGGSERQQGDRRDRPEGLLHVPILPCETGNSQPRTEKAIPRTGSSRRPRRGTRRARR
jgi:hypothetical protein